VLCQRRVNFFFFFFSWPNKARCGVCLCLGCVSENVYVSVHVPTLYVGSPPLSTTPMHSPHTGSLILRYIFFVCMHEECMGHVTACTVCVFLFVCVCVYLCSLRRMATTRRLRAPALGAAKSTVSSSFTRMSLVTAAPVMAHTNF
jgi:hypothetical protein